MYSQVFSKMKELFGSNGLTFLSEPEWKQLSDLIDHANGVNHANGVL
jgi:hypothetical protein